MLKYVKSNDVINIIDIGQIIVIHLLSSVFFVAGGDSFNGRICDDFMDLHDYNWGQAVVDYLIKSVNKKASEKVRGCTVLLHVKHHKFNLPKHNVSEYYVVVVLDKSQFFECFNSIAIV